MKKTFLLLALMTTLGNVSGQTPLPQILMPSEAKYDPKAVSEAADELSLDGLWAFRYSENGVTTADSLFYRPDFDDASWATIQVPGSWETQGFAGPQYDLALKDGTGLYRRGFTVPETWQGKQVYLAFDAVCYGYSLWIDGQPAGAFHSAYNRHIFDVTPLAGPGEHLLAVRVETHPMGWEFDVNDDWSLGGICRPVTLFALNPVHLADLTVTTALKPDGGAEVVLKPQVTLGSTPVIKACLYDADNRLCATATSTAADLLRLEVPAGQCRLWTAETPYLYRLETSLFSADRRVDRHVCRIGLREVSIEGNVLKLNRQTIKLRGATHHDLSPLTGRWVTRQDQLRDLLLMKRGNMNYVRTSHYPPTEDLIDLCDSLGLYVICEVPFGKGDEHLRDTAYLPLLLDRARHTVARDKNHPSVIAWSVGNENPYTRLEEKTGLYVASLDSTRPYMFPERGSTFRGFDERGRLPLADIYAPHYPTVDRVENYGERFDRPIIFTEYAHALGTDFGQMQEIWDIILRHKGLAGGSVWELFDQGLLRQSPVAVCRDSITDFVWTDSVTFYDTKSDYGTDGIVYAARTPQTDYWQARKVYSPVRLAGEASLSDQGEAICRLTTVNRFDFTDLKEVEGRWELLCGPDVVAEGPLSLQAAPHDTVQTVLPVRLPESIRNPYTCAEESAEGCREGCRPPLYFRFRFTDREGYGFYEKSVEVADARIAWASQPSARPQRRSALRLRTEEVEELAAMMEVHAGRKSTMSERATVANNPTRRHVSDQKRLALKSLKWVEKRRGRMVADCVFAAAGTERSDEPDAATPPTVSGQIVFEACPGQAVRITYRLKGSGDWHLSEAGLVLRLPKTFEDLHWVGQGPYSALPARNALSEYGVWAINRDDLYYPGNRQGVEAALLADRAGQGWLMWADSPFDMALELHPDALLVGHNCFTAMPYNKNVHPRNLQLLPEISFEGRFTVKRCDLTDPALSGVFGDLSCPVAPFSPFFHSYDR